MRAVRSSIILLSIVIGLSACSGKKSKKGFMLFPFGAGVAMLDQNGNALPENTGNAQQEAATSGPATVTGSIEPMNGSAVQSGFDFSGIEVSLVDPQGNVIATTTPDNFGSFTFNVPDLHNNNYRVLIPDGGGLNQGHVDFNFVFNPSQSGATAVNLQPISTQVQQFTAGPAKISGKALTPGYTDGVTTVAAGPLPAGTTVQLLDADDNVIASTTTNASGDYVFNQANLHNGNYTVRIVGSAQSASGRPFTDVSVGFHFAFEGYNINTATNVNLSPAQSAWTPATKAPATIGGQVDNAANVIAASGLTVKLMNAGGSVVAQTTTDGSGAYSLSSSMLDGGIYYIEVSGSGYNSQTASVLFVPLATGASTSLTVNNISIVPKQSNIAGTIRDAASSASVAGAVISFRPSSTQPVSKLSYLLTDPVLGAAAARWIAEKNATGNYVTYLTKSYNGPDGNGNLYMTAVAGKWSYYVSAPGYQSSSSAEITLNGADQAANIALNSDPKRSRIAGQAVVVDTLVDGSKQSYGGSVTGYTNQGYAIPGLIVVMLNNRNNAGDAVAHVTTTSASGSFTFTNVHVVLPSGLADDASRVAYAAGQYAAGNATTGNISGTDAATDSITTDGTNYYFKTNSYSIFIVDPRGHMSASLTTANNGSVASNTPTSGTVLTAAAMVSHLARGRISGVVTDAFSTAAISGATVQLGKDSNPDPTVVSFTPARKDSNPISSTSRLSASADVVIADQTTPANGSYSFDNIDPGDYVLQIVKSGYVTTVIPVTVPSNGGSVSVNPPIVVDGPKGNLTGYVKLPGGFNFTDPYTLEVTSPVSGVHPPSGVVPASLASGATQFANAPQYSIFSLPAGVWKLRFVAAGYTTVEGLVTIQGNATTNFDIITMVPGSQGPAAVSGRAFNALNNQAISGLSVRLRPGVGVTNGAYATDSSGTTLPAAATGSNGAYVIANVPAGNYTLEVSGTGYATTYRTVISAGTDTPASQDILVSPVLANNEVRIVLAWNATPKDLDSHLEYGSSWPNQVVWNDRTKLSGDLLLDYDVVTGYGPETVTMKGTVWTQPRRGYSVYNWSRGQNRDTVLTIGQSGATIRVFKSQGLVRSYAAGPSQVNDWWQLFCFSAAQDLIDVGQPGCDVGTFFNAPRN